MAKASTPIDSAALFERPLFTEDDARLFECDDLQLRADALQMDVLPRLMMLMHHCIGMVRKVYEVEALELSSISQAPQHRRSNRRKKPVLFDYSEASIGLRGRNSSPGSNLWPGYPALPDGRRVTYLSFGLQFTLSRNGLQLRQTEGLWHRSSAWREKVHAFLLREESIISALMAYYCLGTWYPCHLYTDSGPIQPLRQTLADQDAHGLFFHTIESDVLPLPISPDSLTSLVRRFVGLYPVFHALLALARGEGNEHPVFHALIAKLNAFEREHVLNNLSEDSTDVPEAEPSVDVAGHLRVRALELASSKVRVLPGIRWQALARDHWRCVACGRGAASGTLLHVDHIVPRSLGGPDSLANYQTLCWECNIGKSNRDSTSLRHRQVQPGLPVNDPS